MRKLLKKAAITWKESKLWERTLNFSDQDQNPGSEISIGGNLIERESFLAWLGIEALSVRDYEKEVGAS